MLRKHLFFGFLSFLLLLITGFFIRANDRVADIWVSHIVYFLAVVVSIRLSNMKPFHIALAYFLGYAIPTLFAILMDGFSLIFLLNDLSFAVAIWSGYWFSRSAVLNKFGAVALSLFYCISAMFLLSKPLLHYESFGNFDGRVNEQLSGENCIVNNIDTVCFANSEKYILLDFWTTTCGVCFQKFPLLETAYKQYKTDKRVVIYAVNVPVKRDTGLIATTILDKRNYSFSKYYSYKSIDTNLNVASYPTTLLIYKNNIIGRGDIENVLEILSQSLKE